MGPVAILGLVVAGLGLINWKFGAELTNMLALAREKGPEVSVVFRQESSVSFQDLQRPDPEYWLKY